jgi:hypothetical protein
MAALRAGRVPSHRNVTTYRELCCGGGALDTHMKGLMDDVIRQLTGGEDLAGNDGPPKAGKAIDGEKEKAILETPQKEMNEAYDPETVHTPPPLTPTVLQVGKTDDASLLLANWVKGTIKEYNEVKAMLMASDDKVIRAYGWHLHQQTQNPDLKQLCNPIVYAS